jgi:hypothetical protein
LSTEERLQEEAQHGQSVNYDVELLHHSNAHQHLDAANFLNKNSKMMLKPDHGIYNTTRLKWCTAGPKLKSDKVAM